MLRPQSANQVWWGIRSKRTQLSRGGAVIVWPGASLLNLLDSWPSVCRATRRRFKFHSSSDESLQHFSALNGLNEIWQIQEKNGKILRNNINNHAPRWAHLSCRNCHEFLGSEDISSAFMTNKCSKYLPTNGPEIVPFNIFFFFLLCFHVYAFFCNFLQCSNSIANSETWEKYKVQRVLQQKIVPIFL